MKINYEDKCKREKDNVAMRATKKKLRSFSLFKKIISIDCRNISDSTHDKFSVSYSGKRLHSVSVTNQNSYIFICVIISHYILSSKRGHLLICTSQRAQKEGSDSVGINFHVKKNTRKMVLISKEHVDLNGICDADINERPSQKQFTAQKIILFAIW